MSNPERKAVTLFIGTGLIAAIAVGATIVAEWGGGSLDNRIEPMFWAGAILAAIAIAVLGAATLPDGERSPWLVVGLTRAGVILFLTAPALCVTAIFLDYWI